MFLFRRILRPPSSTPTATLFPYTPLCLSADAAETRILALVVEPRRSRQLPPARLAADRHRHDQVRKALAPLHPLCHVVQRLGKLPRLPRIASQRLEQRQAFQRLGGRADSRG